MGKDRALSFYQLEKSEDMTLARLASESPLVGPGVILWEDDRLLYALVEELPSGELQKLASRELGRALVSGFQVAELFLPAFV